MSVLLLALSHGNLDVISTSPSSGRHLPSVFDSQRGLLEEILVVSYVKVFSDPEVDPPLHLKIWVFTGRFVSESHFSRSRQSTAFEIISRIFYVKVNSHPEVQSDCTRDKVFIWRWRRVGFSPFLRHFSHSVCLDVEC